MCKHCCVDGCCVDDRECDCCSGMCDCSCHEDIMGECFCDPDDYGV
jgi:hypothetical protein